MKISLDKARKIVEDIAYWANVRNGNGFRTPSLKKNGGTKKRPLTYIDRLTQKVLDNESIL